MSALGAAFVVAALGPSFLVAALGRGLYDHFPAEGSGPALNRRFVRC